MFSSAILILKHRGVLALVLAIRGVLVSAVGKLLGWRFVKRKIYDYRMWLDLQDRGISRGLLLFGNRELEHREMLSRIVNPGMTIFDVGANIGYYAIMESKLVGDKGRIIAIEPSPSNIELLQKNLRLNAIANVEVLSGAVSDKNGKARFHLSHQSNLNTFHAIGSGLKHLSGQSIDVETQTISQLSKTFGKPDLIRMDVEGHEVAVLNGAMEDIRLGIMRPAVIFETHLTRYNLENDMSKTLRCLFDFGYRIKLAASSWEEGSERIEALGYKPEMSIKTDGNIRKIFSEITNEDAIELICKTGGLRTIFLTGDR